MVPGMTREDQKPFIRFNAPSGKWRIDDQVHDRVTMIMDFDHAESGYVRFSAGTAPDYRLVSMESVCAGGPYPQEPPDTDAQGKPAFSRGFRMTVKLSDKLAAGKPSVRELASGTQCLVRAVDDLHTNWLASRQNGKVPVVTVDGYEPVPGNKGSTNYKPQFRITGWIVRPDDLKPNKGQTSAPQPSGPQPTPPAHVVDPIGEPEVFDEDPSFT